MAESVSRTESSEQVLNNKTRILVADDELDARTLIGVALDKRKHEVTFCTNGQQAIESCSKELPDLAILDIQMPQADGITVCQWIKEHAVPTFVPVILLTSRGEVSDKVNGLNCGADDYVTKPFAVAELAARVDSFLRIKSLADQLQQTQNLLAEREKELVAMQVAGAAAHELGQPLTSIVLNCELLSCSDKDTEAFFKALQTITSECRRARAILARLKEIDHYETKLYADNMEILDLSLQS